MALTEAQIAKLGHVLMGKLFDLSIQQKTTIAAKAGLDISAISNIQYNKPVNDAIFKALSALSPEDKQSALPVIAEGIGRNRPSEQEDLARLLKQHGYQFTDGVFVPVGLLDDRDKPFIPKSASELMATAIQRLADGDENGAITAACGAVDTATIAIYEKEGWGRPPDSFQTKVNTVLSRLKIYEEMLDDLIKIGVKPDDVKSIVGNLHEATKHASDALQVIRRSLGDVHGKRPAYTRLTYDTIKWALAICGLLEGRI